MSNVVIRKGEKKDCPILKKLLVDLIDYHIPEYESPLTSKDLEIDGFGQTNFFKCLIAETDTPEGKRIVGFVTYYYLYSSFLGCSSYLEGFFVTEEFRSFGIGKAFLKALVKEVLDAGCSRIDFVIAKWNAPTIKFYKKYGAVNLTEEEGWSFFRIEYNEMVKMVENFDINSLSLKTTSDSKDIGNVIVRKGEIKDCAGIMENIITLAHYEKIPERVKINSKVLEADGFGDQKLYNIFVAEEETPQGKKIIGYVMYVFGHSTKVGRNSFMEDLFVTEERRHIGLGTALWKAVIQDTLQKGGKESNFTVLNWNTPSIDFYLKYGAYNLTDREEWDFYRYDRSTLEKILA